MLSPAQLSRPPAHTSELQCRFAAPPRCPCAPHHPSPLHGHMACLAQLTCDRVRCARHGRQASQGSGHVQAQQEEGRGRQGGAGGSQGAGHEGSASEDDDCAGTSGGLRQRAHVARQAGAQVAARRTPRGQVHCQDGGPPRAQRGERLHARVPAFRRALSTLGAG